MKKIIFIFSFLIIPFLAHSMGFFNAAVHSEGVQETTIENMHQQVPMTSLMQTMQRLYGCETTKTGISLTNFREKKSEKTFLGMTAPISDFEMDLYLTWQKRGELPLMREAIKRLDIEINQRSSLSFDRFKLERRKSFLSKVMSNEITKNLSIVRHGTLEQAEQMVDALENPPVAQFDSTYQEIKKEERILARKILKARGDYRAKIKKLEQQKKQESSPDASIIHDFTLATPTDTNYLPQACDLVSTPVHRVPNISKEVDLRIEEALKSLSNVVSSDYLQSVEGVLQKLKSDGLLEPSQDLMRMAIIHGIKHFLNEFNPSSVYEHPKEFAINVATYTGLALFHIATDGVFIGTEKTILLGAQLQSLSELMSRDYSELSPNQCAELIAEKVADFIKIIVADKVARKAMPSLKKSVPLTSSHTNNALEASAQEAVTPEGLVVSGPQAIQETGVLKNTSEKVGSTGTQVAKTATRVKSVANMKQVFEMNDFGRMLKKRSEKTKFVDIYTDSQVYKLTGKLPELKLKKGDKFYLDKFHGDHIEVFRNDDCITVLNLDGTVNEFKKAKALQEGRTLQVR